MTSKVTLPSRECPSRKHSGRHLRGDVRIEVQRHKAALPPVYFDQAKGAAGWLGVHEFVHEGAIDGQDGKHVGSPNKGGCQDRG